MRGKKRIYSCKRRILLSSLQQTSLLTLGLAVIPSVACAQNSAAPAAGAGIAEIVVTATRKEESAQRVPISLTAIGGEQLDKYGVTSVLQLPQLAPSMYVVGVLSSGSPRYTLRGISNSDTLAAASSAVATYIDDVYQASQYGLSSALFDLQRVEVLRGPQGTTFGQNTTGGAIAYFSQVPTNEFSGYVTGRLAGGDQAAKFLQGAVNLPLVDQKLALRVSVNVDRKGNFVESATNPSARGNGHSHAERVQLRWTPADATAVNLTGFYTRSRYDGAIARAEYGPGNVFGLPANILDIDRADQTPFDNLVDNFVNKGATLRIEQGLGDFNLTAISHYRRTSFQKGNDSDGRPEDLFAFYSRSVASQYGQEVRLSSNATMALSGLLGASFQKEKLVDVSGGGSSTATSPLGEYNNHGYQKTRTTTYALFGNLKYSFTDELSVTAGLRKTFQKRSQNALLEYFLDRNFDWTEDTLAYFGPAPIEPSQSLPYSLKQKSRPWTWDVTVDYKPNSSILVFGRVARGFRSGGFNPGGIALFAFQLPQATPLPFGNETLQSYELGIKSSWFDRRLRFNAGVFHYDFNNQQVVVPGPGGIPTTDNAGKSKIDGGEIEILANPVDRLDLSLNASYTDARYKQYLSPAGDYSGKRLIQAPEWTLNAAVTWAKQLTDRFDFVFNTFWSYRSDLYFTPDNTRTFRAGPLTIGNLRAGIEPVGGKGFSVNVFINNVTDKKPLAFGASFGPETNIKYFDVGRLYGVDVSFKW